MSKPTEHHSTRWAIMLKTEPSAFCMGWRVTMGLETPVLFATRELARWELRSWPNPNTGRVVKVGVTIQEIQ